MLKRDISVLNLVQQNWMVNYYLTWFKNESLVVQPSLSYLFWYVNSTCSLLLFMLTRKHEICKKTEVEPPARAPVGTQQAGRQSWVSSTTHNTMRTFHIDTTAAAQQNMSHLQANHIRCRNVSTGKGSRNKLCFFTHNYRAGGASPLKKLHCETDSSAKLFLFCRQGHPTSCCKAC